VSVALPLWEHVVAYEENDPELLGKLRAGYPRFFPPLAVRKLSDEVAGQLGLGEERLCSLFPTEAAARRCAEYVAERADGWEVSSKAVLEANAHAVIYPDKLRQIADDYWRYCGDGISGRLASAAIDGDEPDKEGGEQARKEIVSRLSSGTGQSEEDVFLFPSGMAAVAAVHRAVGGLAPGCRSAQFDFPYVDVLRVQREIGGGVLFLPSGDREAVDRLGAALREERMVAVYCEVPSNPLLRSADLPLIREMTRAAGVPLIVDDTVATHINIDAFEFADIVTTSLTKAFSGTGDVLAGAATVSATSPLAAELRTVLAREADTPLWDGDAIALEKNSRDYAARVAQVNRSASKVVKFLRSHPAVERVYYPETETPEAYASAMKPGGGYGGLLSVLLKEAERAAPVFYDALRWNKGPSLGANFSLACPYTLLAHYEELDWCESLGVSRYLIRLSVGLEGEDELIARLDEALASLA
jgi:cystathionine gamma-synthase